jgi:hypothetical protein
MQILDKRNARLGHGPSVIVQLVLHSYQAQLQGRAQANQCLAKVGSDNESPPTISTLAPNHRGQKCDIRGV